LTRIEKARELRRNQTPAEALVWSALRRGQLDGYHFRRQYPKGPYIFDFVCLAAKRVLEIDGPSHDQTVEYDNQRTRYMERLGFKVIRFSNDDVRQSLRGVAETIRQMLNSDTEER
jgi:very-short-patch-repair endonuclease